MKKTLPQKRTGLSSTIYTTTIGKVQTVFLPTSQRVKRAYHNGEVGDQLWEQITGGRFTQNMWTRKEIDTLFRVAGGREPIEGVVLPLSTAIATECWDGDDSASL